MSDVASMQSQKLLIYYFCASRKLDQGVGVRDEVVRSPVLTLIQGKTREVGEL
jgi:hypothetical protein